MNHDYKGSKPCHETHPVLDIGGGKQIWGGSCGYPTVDDADIYIGFDGGMKKRPSAYPWNDGHSVHFSIPDGCPPQDIPEFKKMIEWVCVQVDLGRKVHCGCIGGHGRTGMFLSALVAHRGSKIGIEFPDGFTDDPIAYVRKNYCDRAVESQSQVDFLVKEYGCKAAAPSKKSSGWGGSDKSKATGWSKPYSPSTHEPKFWDGWKSPSQTKVHGAGTAIYSSKASYSGGNTKTTADSGSPARNELTVWSHKVVSRV